MAIENERWPELSVLQAAHAAELLVKARIAQEHPLLIFDQLPRSTQATGPTLGLEDLFKSGRTIQWTDLPERLWASTGLTIPNKEKFDAFGRLRNGFQHFGPARGVSPSEETLEFVFGVIDPFINQSWGLFAVDYNEDYEPHIYFVGALVEREIMFLVSPAAAATFDEWSVDWSGVSPKYRKAMHKRVAEAKRAAASGA